jgi:hypothetical protein
LWPQSPRSDTHIVGPAQSVLVVLPEPTWDAQGARHADSVSVKWSPPVWTRTSCAALRRSKAIGGSCDSFSSLAAIDGYLKSGADVPHALVGQAAEALNQDSYRHALD